VGAIGTRLAVGAVCVLLAVGSRLAVRPRLPIRAADVLLIVGVGLAGPALAVSLISLRVRLSLGGGLTRRQPVGLTVSVRLPLRVLSGPVLRLRPIVVVELLRADLRWITRTVFGVVGHVRHRFRSDTVCTPPP